MKNYYINLDDKTLKLYDFNNYTDVSVRHGCIVINKRTGLVSNVCGGYVKPHIKDLIDKGVVVYK